MTTSRNFAILIRFNCNCTICISVATFASLVKFDFKFSMATYGMCLLSFILSLNILELKLNLSWKNWNALKFALFLEMTC
jgi:hypothetical protein